MRRVIESGPAQLGFVISAARLRIGSVNLSGPAQRGAVISEAGLRLGCVLFSGHGYIY